MPITIDGSDFELLPSPSYGQYKKVRSAKKVSFQAAGGYKHQREAFTSPKYQFPLGWKLLNAAEHNMLVAWLDFAKSNAFYFIVPDTAAFAGMELEVHLVRIIDEETEIEPVSPGWYRASITLEDV